MTVWPLEEKREAITLYMRSARGSSYIVVIATDNIFEQCARRANTVQSNSPVISYSNRSVFGTFCQLLHYCSPVIIVLTKRIITAMIIIIIMHDVSRCKFRFLIDSAGEGRYTRHKITHGVYVRAFIINSYTCARDCSRFVRSAAFAAIGAIEIPMWDHTKLSENR